MLSETQDLFMNIINKSLGAYICLRKADNGSNEFYPVYVNEEFEKSFELTFNQLRGTPFTYFLASMSFDHKGILHLMNEVDDTGKSKVELVYSKKNRKHYKTSIFKATDCCISCLFFDVSEYEEKEEEEIYKYISDSSSDGFQYLNNKTGYILTSKKWHDLFGLTKDQLEKKLFVERIHQDNREAFIRNIVKAKRNLKDKFKMEYRLCDGKTWIDHSANFKYEDNDKCIEEVHYFKDITELKEKQLELEYMAYFDTKTRTYNRKYFVDFLSAAVKKAKRKDKKIDIMYIDIDDFKKVNDSIGFTLGDELITKFSRMLLKNESRTIKVGRICNDEFVIAIYDTDENSCAENIYAKIVRCLERPIKLSNGFEIYLKISVGISKFPESAQTADDLIKAADIAMYNIKDREKNSVTLFENWMLEEFMENVNLEQRLKEAVAKGDFYLCFQPQYDSNKGKIRGVEALIRWQDGDKGVISPAKFIPMAEKSGYIIDIGKWVIKEALSSYATWKHEYNFKGIISINISPIQLKDINFTDILVYYTEINNLKPSDIEIEITESVFIGDTKITAEILKDIKFKGYRISLDDFGTGYSSLSYLKDVPINTLKIDKTFVDSVVKDESTNIITKAVIDMVKKLGLETIAEGVETKEQYEHLQKMNCDNIQGFLLGKPMKKVDLLEVIMEERAAHI